LPVLKPHEATEVLWSYALRQHHISQELKLLRDGCRFENERDNKNYRHIYLKSIIRVALPQVISSGGLGVQTSCNLIK